MRAFAGGVWLDEGRGVAHEALEAMLRALPGTGSSRGVGQPAGVYRVPLRPGLAHRPIPGVALGSLGASPLTRYGGSLAGVFHGALDNRIELRRRLDGRGVEFQSGGDVEILLHLFRDEGPDCFTHLQGSFAAVVWDAGHQRLVLARDPWGTLPLFFAGQPGRFLFASGPRALLTGLGGEAVLDLAACDEYLTYGFVPAPHCLFAGVQKLPPGYVAIWKYDHLEFNRYADPRRTLEEPAARGARQPLAEALRDAVRRQLADRRGAIWLRGDAASGALASVAADVAPDRVLAVALEGDRGAQGSRALAERLRLPLQLAVCKLPGADALSYQAAGWDEPLADEDFWTWKLAAEQAGADAFWLAPLGAAELLGAHARYARCRAWGDILPRWLFRLVAPRAAKKREEWQLRNKTLPLDQQRRYLAAVALFNESARARLYRVEHLARLPDDDPFDLLRGEFLRSAGRGAVEAFQLADLAHDVPDRQVATAAAALRDSGASLRLPFLEANALRAGWTSAKSVRPGRGQRALRRLLRPCLRGPVPHSATTPVASLWLRSGLAGFAQGRLLEASGPLADIVQREALRALWTRHLQGDAALGKQLWSLLMLDLWLEAHRVRIPPAPAAREAATAVESNIGE